MKKVLHIGAGGQRVPEDLFPPAEWEEVTLDINPNVNPDIISSSTCITEVSDGSFSAAYSSHSIEHLFAHEVPLALSEMYRVLKSGGRAFIACPNLAKVMAFALGEGLTATAYTSPAGPVTPLDMLYGHIGMVAGGNHYMAHKCGFTPESLKHEMECAGFSGVKVIASGFDMLAQGKVCK